MSDDDDDAAAGLQGLAGSDIAEEILSDVIPIRDPSMGRSASI
jgi:hypothetical protein